ncbi:hypothetical protein ELI02_29860 (plasmid) [Rhizobium leguminosarum]|uniref:hypothetical protein n=1 Tax=Rhizobium leguminosarum TaxID=384 RepID=UPI001031F616|nr:hypothetical protein [Rhizobium leguminosarum]TAX45922.1 hypothetical protein ELI02_29860 [Rhizobium leguminosarum]
MVETANNIWADGPSADPYEPDKRQIREWGTWVEGSITAFLASGGKVYATRAALYADLSQTANTMAWVISDPTAAYNGIYRKNGAANSGSWTRLGDLPYSFIVATDVGAGTPNAIQATTSIPVSQSALIILGVSEANTGSPVTVSFNGGSPLAVKTNSGNDVLASGLVAGMQLLGVISGSTFRLVSDQVSSAIVAAAEDAADRAEAAAAEAADWADLAKNNFVQNSFTGDGTTTDFLLSVDPGSANNMFVNVGGVSQPISAYTLEHVGSDAYLRISGEPVPDDVEIDVRFGNKVTVGTPTDGSITTAKLGADSVTAAKMSATDAVAIRAKIGAAASGTAITNAQMPTGSIVDSAPPATYAANASLTAVIPRDDTAPQISEGTEILTVSITPKSSTNKLRCRFKGQISRSAAGTVIAAIFATGTSISGTAADARRAVGVSVPSADQAFMADMEVEFVPGITTAVTVSVRVGPDAVAGFARLNGSSAGRLLGGTSAATLVVEEIKA